MTYLLFLSLVQIVTILKWIKGKFLALSGSPGIPISLPISQTLFKLYKVYKTFKIEKDRLHHGKIKLAWVLCYLPSSNNTM